MLVSNRNNNFSFKKKVVINYKDAKRNKKEIQEMDRKKKMRALSRKLIPFKVLFENVSFLEFL